jgi:uncharacterized membrane protein
MLSERRTFESVSVPVVSPQRRLLQLRLGVAAMTVIVTAALAGILLHLVDVGWAHSFDSAIYARNLWGIANGQTFNPIVQLQAMSVHFNLVLYPLAPLTTLINPTIVLLLAQGIALGATYAVMALHTANTVERHGLDTVAMGASTVMIMIALLASPMVINPFMFDVRPDLIGVPLISAGLLRALATGAWDRLAVSLVLASLLVREEFAMVIVASLLLTPWTDRSRAQIRMRAGAALFAVVWLLAYWYLVRPAMGDDSFARANTVASSFADSEVPLSPVSIAGYKLEIIAAFAASFGGLTLMGWRWWGAALPGMLLLLATPRLQALVLNFHYVMFVTPAVIVASADGCDRLIAFLRRTRPAVATPLVASMLLALTLAYGISSAGPQGGRFRQENFAVAASDSTPLTHEQLLRLQRAHALMNQYIVDAGGLVVPYGLSAFHADRPAILMWEQVQQDLMNGQPWPEGIDWVVLPSSQWQAAGPMLTHSLGYRLVDTVDPDIALLTRHPGPAGMQPLISMYGTYNCDRPLARWPAAAIELCGVEPLPDGRTAIWLHADGGRPAEPPPWSIFLVQIADRGAVTPAWIHFGLVPPWHLTDTVVPALANAPVGDGTAMAVVLRGPSGSLPATLPDGHQVTEVPLHPPR